MMAGQQIANMVQLCIDDRPNRQEKAPSMCLAQVYIVVYSDTYTTEHMLQCDVTSQME